ncbi:MAG: MBL fold metallo-hydrolase, partial [Leadbetterella sp.]|nr:MBL fold metallo-hydrolase [Leadbetterella sp.]
WGFDPARITEMDWWESRDLPGALHITATPARHFSGRALRRNQTLWCSYVLDTGDLRLFMGGDSGYDTHFREIGEKFGPFDLAILENGQYNLYWKHIHTLPEELADVQRDLRAKAVLPVHSGKFALALHDWDEPLEMAAKHARLAGNRLLTPKIGETVSLDDTTRTFGNWWKTANP